MICKMASLSVYITVFVIISINFIEFCETFKKGDRGVCESPAPSRRTRKGGMYQEKELSCCDNWEYHGPSDTCQPVCPSGCLNGNCIDVDVCECPPHLVKSKNKQNYTICELSCVNSRRDDVGTCECYNDYVKLNETFCIRNCPPGYFNDPIECSPLCDQPCDHGNCTFRNTCTCDPGYKNNDELTCAPECEPSCAKDANEHCVAPDLCQCIDSYRRINETCVPVCDQSCVNGICVSHNVCECDAGYELDDNNKFNCLLICNGHCAKRHCLSPNNCTCNEGYESAGDGCKPKCDSCENGDCIEPNKCKCHEGYEETSEGSCKPKCTMACINGYCSAPNECSCHEGFYKNETGPNECYPKENVDCSTCGSVCQYEGDDYCCFDKKPITVCTPSTVIGPVKAKNTSLAGLGLYWSLGAVVGLILLVIVVLVMQRLWIKRKEYEDGSIKNGARLGSVMYTHPHSLLQRRASEDTADTPSENTVTLLSNDANNHV